MDPSPDTRPFLAALRAVETDPLFARHRARHPLRRSHADARHAAHAASRVDPAPPSSDRRRPRRLHDARSLPLGARRHLRRPLGRRRNVLFSQAPALFDDSSWTPLALRRRWYGQQKDALTTLERVDDGLAAPPGSGVMNVELVSRALVPIVTLTVGGRDVDISADDFNGVFNSSPIEAYFSVHRKARAFL